MMEVLHKLDNLARLCRVSVTVTYNEHTSNYETVEGYLRDNAFGRFNDLSDAEKREMIAQDRVIEVQFYPRTPVGFFVLVGVDLDKLLDQAIEIAKREVER